MEYAVYWNTGASTGGIEPVDSWWSPETPDGVRWQDVGGVHDTFFRSFPTKEEAQTFLESLYENAPKR